MGDRAVAASLVTLHGLQPMMPAPRVGPHLNPALMPRRLVLTLVGRLTKRQHAILKSDPQFASFRVPLPHEYVTLEERRVWEGPAQQQSANISIDLGAVATWKIR